MNDLTWLRAADVALDERLALHADHAARSFLPREEEFQRLHPLWLRWWPSEMDQVAPKCQTSPTPGV